MDHLCKADARLRNIAISAGSYFHSELIASGYTIEMIEEAYYWHTGALMWVPRGVYLWRFPDAPKEEKSRDRLEVV